MKIVHISMADFNGAGLCAYRICLSQRQMGIDSTMIVLRKRRKESFIHRVGAKRYFVHSIMRRLKKFIFMGDDANAARQLARLHHAVYTLPVSGIDMENVTLLKEADLIHIHWVGGYLDYPTFFDEYGKKPIVITLHDENALYGIANIEYQRLPDHPLELKYYKVKYDNLQKARRLGVVFLSQMSYKPFSNHPMIAHAKKRIISNSVNCQEYLPMDKAEARRRLGLPQEGKQFALAACNIEEPRKGLAVLSETLWRINPDYRILAIGRNRSRANFPYPNVIEAGHAETPEDMSWKLSAADYCCMPSYHETFSQVVTEAMACGLPVIGFPCGVTGELLDDSNGVLCADFTSEELEKGIRKALATTYDGAIIRERVQRCYSPEKICGEYLDFYQEIMAM